MSIARVTRSILKLHERLWLSCGLLLFLTACQHVSPVQDKHGGFLTESQWLNDQALFENARKDLIAISHWRVSAKVGLTTDVLREQANLDWRYHDQSHEVRLYGPLGFGAVKMAFDQYGAELIDGDGVTHIGDDARELLARLTGWPLPVNALSSWLFAMPQDGSPFSYRLNDSGQLLTLRQHGWEIEYSGYRDFDGKHLPKKLVARKRNSAEHGGEVEVKFISKKWQW